MGRAARHILGEVVMYADKTTDSMKRAIAEVDRRRKIQDSYNKKHNIIPTQVHKPIRERLIDQEIEDLSRKTTKKKDETDFRQLPAPELQKEIKKLAEMMKYEAEILNFEEAAQLRDKIKELKKIL
jgi:excinuclease ABC subunit B